MGDRRSLYKVWVGRPEENRSLGRPRLRREDNIKMDLKDLGWDEWSVLIFLRIRADEELL
jgi:hypothetical protein